MRSPDVDCCRLLRRPYKAGADVLSIVACNLSSRYGRGGCGRKIAFAAVDMIFLVGDLNTDVAITVVQIAVVRLILDAVSRL